MISLEDLALHHDDEELTLEPDMPFSDAVNVLTDKLVDFSLHVGAAIVVFYVGRYIIKKLLKLLDKLLQLRNVDESICTFLHSGAEYSLFFLLIIVVIGILGIETSSFIALFASAGVALGMALSGTLQNFAGGVLILSLKPYRIGDYIEAQGYAGTVKKIEIFSTYITTPDNKTIIIPNGPLSTGSINNYSRQQLRRVDWTVCVAYGTDFDHAEQVIRGILAADKRVLADDADHAVAIFLNELADSSVNIAVRAWVDSADYWGVYFDVNKAIYATLPREGISFPFPQMDVHVTSA
jgi:small conductance mechanosensitive channel